MGIRDQNIDWIRKRIWIPHTDFLCWQEPADGIQVVATATGIIHTEMAALGIMGADMDANEVIRCHIPVPYDLDPSKDVGFRVCFAVVSSGASCTVSWIMLQDFIDVNEAFVLATAALDTIIPLLTSVDEGGADDNTLTWTARGLRSKKAMAGTTAGLALTRANIEAGSWISISLEMDAAANETSTLLLGIQMDYAPMKTLGGGNINVVPLQANGLA